MTKDLKIKKFNWNKEDAENIFNYMLNEEDQIVLTDAQWEKIVAEFQTYSIYKDREDEAMGQLIAVIEEEIK
jgi:hypothetical protein